MGKHQCRAYVVRISPSVSVWRGYVAELVPSERRTPTVAYTCRAWRSHRRGIGNPITSNVHQSLHNQSLNPLDGLLQ